MSTNELNIKSIKTLAITGLVATLVACGGGGGSDDEASTSEPVVTRGVITQLGSIWVNGVEYETPNGGTYSDDDNTNSIADYKVGQVVSVRGRRNDDGVSGTATHVEYEAEIEGAADANGEINGISILRTPLTNAPGIPSPLANGSRYEVSGIWLDDFTLEATYIKVDDDGDDEMKGYVKNDGASSFDLRGITFNWTGTPDVTCSASIVELEDDYFDLAEGHEIEIEGAVNTTSADLASLCPAVSQPAAADFVIDTTCINWDSVTASGWMDGLTGPDDMANGLRVEAEGHMVNGILIAEKIKGRGNRVRISSIAGNVTTSPDSFQLIEGNIDVVTKSGVTEYEDGLTIGNIDGQEVEVRGVRTGPNEILAIRIKPTGLAGSGSRHELRAEVDVNGVDSAAGTVASVSAATFNRVVHLGHDANLPAAWLGSLP